MNNIKLKQYEKTETFKSYPRLYLGSLINIKYDNVMDVHSNIRRLNPIKLELTFEESCNEFLKTCKGLSYLCMKYPNLSLQDAIKEYKLKEAEAEFYCP